MHFLTRMSSGISLCDWRTARLTMPNDMGSTLQHYSATEGLHSHASCHFEVRALVVALLVITTVHFPLLKWPLLMSVCTSVVVEVGRYFSGSRFHPKPHITAAFHPRAILHIPPIPENSAPLAVVQFRPFFPLWPFILPSLSVISSPTKDWSLVHWLRVVCSTAVPL